MAWHSFNFFKTKLKLVSLTLTLISTSSSVMSSPSMILTMLRDIISLNSSAISMTVLPSDEALIADDHLLNVYSRMSLKVSIMPVNLSL